MSKYNDEAKEAAWQKMLEIEKIAKEKARQKLPCQECGQSVEPKRCKPQRNSWEWWDDPSAYVGCGNCGYFLALLDPVGPFMWGAEDK